MAQNNQTYGWSFECYLLNPMKRYSMCSPIVREYIKMMTNLGNISTNNWVKCKTKRAYISGVTNIHLEDYSNGKDNELYADMYKST